MEDGAGSLPEAGGGAGADGLARFALPSCLSKSESSLRFDELAKDASAEDEKREAEGSEGSSGARGAWMLPMICVSGQADGRGVSCELARLRKRQPRTSRPLRMRSRLYFLSSEARLSEQTGSRSSEGDGRHTASW